MQTLKLPFSLPDDVHPHMELRLSANDAACNVVITLPLRSRNEPTAIAGASASEAATTAADDYVLGGYAGI